MIVLRDIENTILSHRRHAFGNHPRRPVVKAEILTIFQYVLDVFVRVLCLLVLAFFDAFGEKVHDTTLTFTTSTASALQHANGRTLHVEADDQIHFADIQPFLSYTG